MQKIVMAKLIKDVAKLTGLPQRTVKKVVQTMLDYIVEQLSRGAIVSLYGFGKFYTNYVKPYKLKHALLGETIEVPGRHSPRVRFSKRVKKRLN